LVNDYETNVRNLDFDLSDLRRIFGIGQRLDPIQAGIPPRRKEAVLTVNHTRGNLR
jgi:hypothetical protein